MISIHHQSSNYLKDFHTKTLSVFINWNGNKANQVSIRTHFVPSQDYQTTFAKVMPNTSCSSSSPVNQIPGPFQDCPQWQLHQRASLKAPWFSQNISAFTQHKSTSCLRVRRYTQGTLKGSTYGSKCQWWKTKAGEVKNRRTKESLPSKSSQRSSWVRRTNRSLDACSHHPIKHLLYAAPRLSSLPTWGRLISTQLMNSRHTPISQKRQPRLRGAGDIWVDSWTRERLPRLQRERGHLGGSKSMYKGQTRAWRPSPSLSVAINCLSCLGHYWISLGSVSPFATCRVLPILQICEGLLFFPSNWLWFVLTLKHPVLS